jgi:hypothetical protein
LTAPFFSGFFLFFFMLYLPSSTGMAVPIYLRGVLWCQLLVIARYLFLYLSLIHKYSLSGIMDQKSINLKLMHTPQKIMDTNYLLTDCPENAKWKMAIIYPWDVHALSRSYFAVHTADSQSFPNVTNVALCLHSSSCWLLVIDR